MLKPLEVPELGDAVADVEVAEIALKVGDQADKDDTLLTLETDKAAMDVPLTEGGTIKEIKVKVGDKVASGDLLAMIEVSDEAGATAPETASRPESAPEPTPEADSTAQPVAAQTVAAEAAPAATPETDSSEYSVTCPELGDEVAEVVVAEIAVKPGDTVEIESALLTLESDKAAMDLPSPVAGTILSIAVKVGDTLRPGDKVALIETVGETRAPAPDEPEQRPADAVPAAVTPASTDSPDQSAQEATPTADTPAQPAPSIPIRSDGAPPPLASPGVRRFARELGCDIARVSGSGRKGRVMKEDVQAYIKGQLEGGAPGGSSELAPLPVPDFSQWGPVEEVSLSRIRQLTGANLGSSWPRLPQVTQHDEADITELEALRQSRKNATKAEGFNLTLLALVIPALVKALKDYPDFNSSLSGDGKSLILKQYWHIGIAVDTDAGLVVPVIKNAEQKGVIALAQELADLSERARTRKLKPDEMQGASMTISSLGGIGGTGFTPIVNAPQVAILGISRSAMKPVWDGTAFQPRLMLPLSLSYDHRVIDGASAARFCRHLAELLGDLRLALF
ncbi:MAG: dihydrolipoyllysine-residue acetyltransferase [Gammaproteobacteria bacterium]|nr:dihydrolipoyllysine-residue acetyltransferase [Gammaproteobacteria bacterium]